MIALSHGSQVFGAFEKYRLSIDMIASSEVCDPHPPPPPSTHRISRPISRRASQVSVSMTLNKNIELLHKIQQTPTNKKWALTADSTLKVRWTYFI